MRGFLPRLGGASKLRLIQAIAQVLCWISAVLVGRPYLLSRLGGPTTHGKTQVVGLPGGGLSHGGMPWGGCAEYAPAPHW